MSQVFRRLRLSADSCHNYSMISAVNQKQGGSSKFINGTGRTLSAVNLLQQSCLLHNAVKSFSQQQAAASQNSNVLLQQQRSMSILTDLLRRKKKPETEEEESIPEEAKTLPLFYEEQKQLTEEEIEVKTNISRLSPYHRRLVHGQMPYTDPKAWFHHTVKYKQRMYGRYGESSGVNPGILWPTREELQDKIEYETIANPFTIQEMVEKKRMMRQMEKEAMDKRQKEVEHNMTMVDSIKEDFLRRVQAKEDEANEAKARREKLVEEVRRHFGYKVDPREEKFQELLAKKEKEQRKKMKEAKKLAKQEKVLERMKRDTKSKEIKPIRKSDKGDGDDED